MIVSNYGKEVVNETLISFAGAWEETSYQIERLQCNVECAEAEFERIGRDEAPPYEYEGSLLAQTYPSRKGEICFTSHSWIWKRLKLITSRPLAYRRSSRCVTRRRNKWGSRNGCCSPYGRFQGVRRYYARFTCEESDVGRISRSDFSRWIQLRWLVDQVPPFERLQLLCSNERNFRLPDVFGAAKGWASIIRAGDGNLRNQFDQFHRRKDTFSFGVCNGCQLMCLLGWVGMPVNAGTVM